MLSYANSMLNPLLYAAFNENFRVGFARACRCLTGSRGAAGGYSTAGHTRGGAGSTTGRRATDQERLKLATTNDDTKSPLTSQRIEVVDVVTVSGWTAARDDVVAMEEVKSAEECDALVAQSSAEICVVANRAVNATDDAMHETTL